MIPGHTKESQNQFQIESYMTNGSVHLGPWSSHIYRTDPRHLCFLLARYKFCAKMLAGKLRVLDVGCGDAFGMPIVAQVCQEVHCIDFEPLVLNEAKINLPSEFSQKCTFSVHDILESPVSSEFDAVYSLDVIEHIPPPKEYIFMENICASLRTDGIVILGTPNIEAKGHASPASKEGHINLKGVDTLRATLLDLFENVFIFSMNDEVVHTGFAPMAHYLIGIGCHKKF